MQIKKNGILQVSVPSSTKEKDIKNFLTCKKQWVLDKLSQQEKKRKLQAVTYKDGDLHWYKGRQYWIKLVITTFSRVELQEDNLLIYCRRNTSVKNALDKWYKQQALNELIQRTQYFAQLHEFPKIKEIKIRSMKARWGSCSSRRVITYNTHLIKASQECIDYVILHELCHLIHQNHQKGFHQLQLKLNPQWKKQKQKLDSFGHQILH
jgi:predicted metal-dependent hydrolase